MYGVIDIGANTIRLSVYKVENNTMSLMFTKKVTAGLAGYINNKGNLSEKGIEQGVYALNTFRRIINNLSIKEVFVFATASLRNINNTLEAVETIEEKTGFKAFVLSGEEEASYDFIGASLKFQMNEGLLIDIGGGSTELVLYKAGAIQKAVSFPIGSLNMYVKHVSEFLPNHQEMKTIKKEIKKELEKISDGPIPIDTKIICGIGGTVRAAAKLKNSIYGIPSSNLEIEVDQLKNILDMYSEERKRFLEHLILTVPDRLHTIIEGMIILKTVAKHFESEKIAISNFGVREGYLYKALVEGKVLQGTEFNIYERK